MIIQPGPARRLQLTTDNGALRSTMGNQAKDMASLCSILNSPQVEGSQPNPRPYASDVEPPNSSIQSLPSIVNGAQAWLTATVRSPPSALHAGQTTPPAGVGRSNGFAASYPSAETARRVNTGAARAHAVSWSASPNTSYSPYGHTGQTSAAAQYAAVSMTPLSNQYATSGDGPTGGPTTASVPLSTTGTQIHRLMRIPLSPCGGQNFYQTMTSETPSRTVQCPVDVQAASRVAYEKRRRNAGASARFRQRRKEKDKEASTTISRLKQQVKKIGEDAAFYKRERDYLAGILVHVPDGKRYFPRPTSPQQRRSSSVSSSGPSGNVSSAYVPTKELVPRH